MVCSVCGVMGRGDRPGIHRSCLSAAIMEMQLQSEDTMDNEPSEDTGVWDLNELWPEEDIQTQVKLVCTSYPGVDG